MNREYCKWFSPNVKREMEMLVFGQAGEPIIFFPTRTARFYDYENWRIIESMRNKIEAGYIQVYCVDSIDAGSFYDATLHPSERILNHALYEDYIRDEVVPFIKKKNHYKGLTLAGCSLGAYHAINFSLRHPQLVTKAVGMSGRYDLTAPVQNFLGLFDGYIDKNIYYNTPNMFIPNLEDEAILKALRKLEIIMVIGKEDPFFQNNLELCKALRAKGARNSFYVWEEEAHRPRYWREMVKYYL